MERDTLIQSYPWLIWNLFYTLSQNTSHTAIMDEIKNKKICAYYDGWLIVKDSKNIHYIINATSLEIVRLPSLNFSYTNCVLTRSPSDFGCHVLFMAKDTIFYCRPGDKKYKRYKLEESMHVMDSIAVFEGKIYYFKSSWELVVIECNESILQFSKIESLSLSRSLPVICDRYLVECGGQLLLVLKSFCLLNPQEELSEIDLFQVFRFNFLNKLWMEVDNIGEFTIFLPRDQYGSISLRAVDPRVKKNSIYFLRCEDEYIHVYDLQNHSFLFHSNSLKLVSLHFQEESGDHEKRNEEFLIPQMPSDLSKLILGRTFTLDPRALGIIRSTCKDWSSIVRPPASDINLRYNSYPYLVTLLERTCNFFHPTYDHTFCLDTPELVGARIMFSKFGCLLLSQLNGQFHRCFFFNPFTKQKITLPGCFYVFTTMSFSSPPTSSDGFVVGVVSQGTILATFKYGESEWSILERLPYTQRVVNYPPIFRKQKCYCIAANKKLIIVDLNTGNISTVGNTFPKELVELNECFLVEDKEGLLFGVFLLTRRKIPRLMRIVKVSRTNILWKSVENLKNKMVYVSPAASCLVSAPTTSTGNKIYFPLFQNSSNIFYSLSTRKYHSYLGNYSCDTPFEVQRMTNCAWLDVE